MYLGPKKGGARTASKSLEEGYLIRWYFGSSGQLDALFKQPQVHETAWHFVLYYGYYYEAKLHFVFKLL